MEATSAHVKYNIVDIIIISNSSTISVNRLTIIETNAAGTVYACQAEIIIIVVKRAYHTYVSLGIRYHLTTVQRCTVRTKCYRTKGHQTQCQNHAKIHEPYFNLKDLNIF